MKNYKILLTVCTIIIVASGCVSRDVTFQHDKELHCHFLNNGTLVIENTKNVLKFTKTVDVLNNMPEPPRILSIKRHGNDYFVLVEISKWSRGVPTPKGYCGCGIEVFLTWMHFSKEELIEQKRYLVHSCFYNITKGSLPSLGNSFSITANKVVKDIRDSRGGVWRKMIYTYDTEHPEKGITVNKSPLMLLENKTGKWVSYVPSKK